KIGYPELLVGREQEFKEFHKWIAGIPKRISKSRVLLGRRKSGKTAFMQRLFNELWTANDKVIPFYISIPETKMWYPDFALLYYRTFVTQYISFLERDPALLTAKPWTLGQISGYGEANSHASMIQHGISIDSNYGKGLYDSVWETAYHAPQRFAAVQEQYILVMIDEFQYLASHIYHPRDRPDESMMPWLLGSYHDVSESKIAPMLAVGSTVGWELATMRQHLKARRLKRIRFSPYLTEDEGAEAVYKYAEVFGEPIKNETVPQINELCLFDPFFISCVIQSSYPNRDLTTKQGVIDTVKYEIENDESELAGTWSEYIETTVERINETYGKQILLHMNKHNNRSWTPKELKGALKIEEDESTIFRKLIALTKGDLLKQGKSNIRFEGLQDGTLSLVVRSLFEEEITTFEPDLRADFEKKLAASEAKNRSIQGKLNDLIGKTAEYYLATKMRTRKRLKLNTYFNDVPAGEQYETRLNTQDIRTRIHIQRDDGLDRELDIVAETSDERVLLVEVKKQKRKSNVENVEDFQEKVVLYQKQNPDATVLPAFLSLGGFTDDARQLCQSSGIAWSAELDGVSF
ncbi:MAG: hypothetical protein AAF639_32955, partial [Chloroflexota bacterium]